MAIEVGQEAPDFTLRNTADEEVTLSSFRGDRNVVLIFFPAAFSGVCAKQFTEVQDSSARYGESDAQVIGVSVDSRYALGRFAEDLGLTDTILLADFAPKGFVSRAYGVYLDTHGHSGRATFVIDKNGIVRGVSLPDHPGLVPDEEEAFTALSICSA